MRFLIVEDDWDLGEAVCRRFNKDGHAADLVGDGCAALELLAHEDYDVVCLDLGLPEKDGYEVIHRLRERGDLTPIIVLTARSQLDAKIETLDVGADDYMVKPVDLRELEARCRALLRRHHGSATGVIEIGDLVIDPGAKRVTVNGQIQPLPNREFRLLEILANNLGRAISKEEIFNKLFDLDRDAALNAVEVYVGRLRRKLKDTITIETVYGHGYMISADGNQTPSEQLA